QVGAGGSIFARKDAGETKMFIAENVKWTSDGFEYINNGPVSYHQMDAGTHKFVVAPSGTADAVINTTGSLSISNSGDVEFPIANQKISGSSTSTGSFGSVHTAGNVGIGTTGPSEALTIGDGDIGIHKGGLTDRGFYLSSLTNQTIGGRANHVELGQVIGQGAKASGWYGALGFYTSTANQDATIKMLISDSGNVGIGTTSPSEPLHIETPASGGGQGIVITRDDSNNDQGIGCISFGNQNADDLVKLIANTENAVDSAELRFFTTNSGAQAQQMVIDRSGNVGIGDTSPVSKLDVLSAGTDDAAGAAYFRKNFGGTSYGSYHNALTIWGHDHDNATTEVGAMITFGGWTDTRNPGISDMRAGIGYQYNGSLTFHAKAGATVADGSNERMRIDGDGKVGIGTTSPSALLDINPGGS
ncbi:MAG: hypothetical protein QF535_15555, partial [Anaerolineales bacterium]|nr:hypothetical protein [Anaerolineales bacterium]